MNYRDIIREMESSGRYSEADDLKRSMEEHHVSEYDRIYNRSDARDGLDAFSYSASVAERAYDDLKYAERREEQRREEEEQHRQHLHDLRCQAERQQEEEFWESQQGGVA